MIRKFYNTDAAETGGPGMTAADKIAKEGIDQSSYKGFGKQPIPESVIINEQEDAEAMETLAGLRRAADGLHKTAEVLSDNKRSRALSLAITSFQEARQFLGCLLKERGSKSPYVKGNDSTTAELEPSLWDPGTAMYSLYEITSPDQWIIAVKKLREKAADVITDFTVYAEQSVSRGFAEAAILPQVYVKLVSGRNWLGEVLGEKAMEANAN